MRPNEPRFVCEWAAGLQSLSGQATRRHTRLRAPPVPCFLVIALDGGVGTAVAIPRTGTRRDAHSWRHRAYHVPLLLGAHKLGPRIVLSLVCSVHHQAPLPLSMPPGAASLEHATGRRFP